ncbi:MAG: ABC transporter permease [Clostridia bacterium]|nr:ABC transporter permease [Oscillospiraceae bacterium]MBQ1954367.1 ABC transporter permease [Clostridia bacterium]
MKNKAKILAAPYLVWMVIFIVVPLGVVVYFAFTGDDGKFTLSNLGEITTYLPTFFDSLSLAALSAFICLLIGYPTAYVISKAPASRQRFLIMLIMLPMCMSFLLRTLALVAMLEDQGIINNFLYAIGLNRVSLIRRPSAVILGMVYNYLPYMIMPLHSVLVKMDSKVIEASQDLGCNGFKVFSKVILPMSLPGIISGITMVFVPAVSTFYISKKLGGTSTAMIGDIIESQFKTSYNLNVGAAMSLGLMVIVLICMGVMNRFSGDGEVDLL